MAVSFRLDVSQFTRKLRETAEREAQAELAAMDEVAKFLSGEAKDRAPFREGFLTESIRGESGMEQGEATAAIFVASNSQAASYAVAMHEEIYDPGPGSVGKQERVGKTVGRKFITRAIDENREKIMEIIAKKIRR